MTSRDRFVNTLTLKKTDRVPYFEEGIRKEVIRAWRKQGLAHDGNPDDLFPKDRREDIQTNLDPIPPFKNWPSEPGDLNKLKKRLKPYKLVRLPQPWSIKKRKLSNRDCPFLLRVHRGLYLSLGVYSDQRFRHVMELLAEKPDFVKEYLNIYSRFTAQLLEKILRDVQPDALYFREPIGGNEGPLISPQMYEYFVLESYKPLIDIARKNDVKIIIFRTYANARIFIPSILKYGFNCLWAHEVNSPDMDYVSIRKEYGNDLGLIGGIDLDALRQGPAAIDKELKDKIPALLQDGGYIPIADGRIRSDVTFQNYVYYRELLEKIIRSFSS